MAGAVFGFTSNVSGCALTTDNADLAIAAINFVNGVLTASEFTSIVKMIDRDFIFTANLLIKSCVGLAL